MLSKKNYNEKIIKNRPLYGNGSK
ncbi:Protein of unknown function [Lactobacillus acidophilus DSM 9126]|nr:Protein of unknown function [Lactobacillus acidophilus DSM 20079 = JCM 1132 = NBRC 13951 = CIP 76.13]CDF70091.1 Protein of unknown function [Lactobacillus acidophilus CIRM-BIA 442]CDF71886.1 Protein of unknown function [Lactobacillus acidophilus CIRM-BIA 445]CDF73706.1 Protein of unknown function [Lactobacillus acidophilus DSM 9126]CDF75708.1 Protein of unknown function [Lactobacillus acidophilus DSM 20242]